VSVASGIETASVPEVPFEPVQAGKLPPGFIATRLANSLQRTQRPLCYVALNEGQAAEIAEVFNALFPNLALVILPPWDCLPYDRVPPSAHCMGRRMDAIRIWQALGDAPKILLTSLDATLQRIAPISLIANTRFELEVGKPFDRDAFFGFIHRTGYVEDGVADDPGEVAVRDDVIDIYPAGAPGPMRIVLSKDNRVEELRGFDRVSQRTESYLESVTFGPASEAILDEGSAGAAPLKSDIMERRLLRLYQDMPTVFDIIDDAPMLLAPGAMDQLTRYLEIIEDAHESHKNLGEMGTPFSRSLYLDRNAWERRAKRASTIDTEGGGELPPLKAKANTRNVLVRFVQDCLQRGSRVVIAGNGKASDAFCRRVLNATGAAALAIESWEAVVKTEPGSLLKITAGLRQGFIDAAQNVVVVAVADGTSKISNSVPLLAEPELRIGDVVVHEDYGVGVLKNLESILVEGVSRDAARLEYRDGGSVLVPMLEFGKLWRYGSEPEAVTLDRLHTDAWQKKREKIAADIRSTARHLLKVAKQRQASQAAIFVPPRAEFTAFTRRFPFAETPDQTQAIKAVLSDLASGKVMNRLVCGDVGFGKTEIALRAAAAVAFARGQVVVIAPTTVLARQHFETFQRRFDGTGVSVGMLSRVLKPSEVKRAKAALETGEIDVIVTTQAVLAKDVRFAHLALLIVDEEHRFGIKEKRAMNALAPSLHTLTMSATPIPRTLQMAMVGVHAVSLLATPPSRRHPIRTSLATFENASLRTGLMREYRRGGQSFVVVPRIEDIDGVEKTLRKIVPELSVKVVHGKMPAAVIDEAVVGFAEGSGDILLATNIIENGLDVPRANTMFVWHAERFGLAQLHQLRGRVGRSSVQGVTTLLIEEGKELAEETRLRLSTIVENDRLGAGLAISLRDLDLRGSGDIAAEDQAGHIKTIGTGLYQKLLADAVAKSRKQPSASQQRAVLNLGLLRRIPADYVSDPAVRLNLYAKLFRASTPSDLDDLEEEIEDRFGEPPREVLSLLQTSRLELAAGRLGIAKLEGGPRALAVTLTGATPAKVIASLAEHKGAVRREDRIIIEMSTESAEEQLHFFERVTAQ
jgi:transcription-repair coupling factor (superfamily II helicase)